MKPTFRLILLNLITTLLFISTQTPIDITPIDSPKNTPDTYYIPIFHTNDIHGFFFPQQIKSDVQSYSSGGVQYLSKYISILREKWGFNFLWFDSGDEFQGGLENKLSQGQIMSDFLNTMQCKAATIGNHEWDFGQEFLQNRLKAAQSYKYYSANLKIADDRKPLFQNIEKTTIIEMSQGVKIGVIGLTTVTTPETTSGNLNGITFEAYKTILEDLVQQLRPQTNVIVLLAHLGLKCPKDEDKLSIKARTKQTAQGQCNTSDEMYQLLHSIDVGLVDVVLAGHKHDVVHHWINGTPVSCNDRNGSTGSVVYLPFSTASNQFLKEKVVIEGPLPSCEKIFDKVNHCNVMETDEEIKDAGNLVNYQYQGVEIVKEPLLDPIANQWYDKLEEYRKEKITETDSTLFMSKLEETALGNLFADILLRITGVDISILNPGGFRKKWPKGVITMQDMYEMSPFDNMIVTMQITGRELMRMMNELQAGQYGFYVTGGLKQVVRQSPKHQLLNLKLYNGIKESNIQYDATYNLATLNFAIPLGGDDFKQILKWYHPRNLVNLEGEYRDHIEKYLRFIKMIHVDELIDEANPRLRIIDP